MIAIPSGLFLTPNFISAEKEAEIITWLDARPWSTEISRRTQHFGYSYNYNKKDITLTNPMEGPILEIAQMIEQMGIMKSRDTNVRQCIVNEYYRNQGIAPHIDNLKFGPIVIGLSIGNDAVMTFTRGTEIFECFLPRLSMVMLSQDARYEWKHSIDKRVTYTSPCGQKITKPQDYRRISLTYRSLSNDT